MLLNNGVAYKIFEIQSSFLRFNLELQESEMGDFRISAFSRIKVVVYCAVLGAVLSTGLGTCPVYPPLPHFDITRVSTSYHIYSR